MKYKHHSPNYASRVCNTQCIVELHEISLAKTTLYALNARYTTKPDFT